MAWDHHIAKIKENFGCTCKAGRNCPNAAGFVVGYKHVSGRAGNISIKHKIACEEHAKKFCVRNDIEFDDLPVLESEYSANNPEKRGLMRRSKGKLS